MPKVGNATPVPICFEESEDPEPAGSFVAIEPSGLLIAALSYASRAGQYFRFDLLWSTAVQIQGRSSVVYGSAKLIMFKRIALPFLFF